MLWESALWESVDPCIQLVQNTADELELKDDACHGTYQKFASVAITQATMLLLIANLCVVFLCQLGGWRGPDAPRWASSLRWRGMEPVLVMAVGLGFFLPIAPIAVVAAARQNATQTPEQLTSPRHDWIAIGMPACFAGLVPALAGAFVYLLARHRELGVFDQLHSEPEKSEKQDGSDRFVGDASELIVGDPKAATKGIFHYINANEHEIHSELNHEKPGLKWRKVDARPADGVELTNETLRKVLGTGRMILTQPELDQVVQEVGIDPKSTIRVNGSWFRLANGTDSVKDEWERGFQAGVVSREDMDNLRYVLECKAGSSDKRFQNGWQRDRDPVSGNLLEARKGADGNGMVLADFAASDEAIDAGLDITRAWHDFDVTLAQTSYLCSSLVPNRFPVLQTSLCCASTPCPRSRSSITPLGLQERGPHLCIATRCRAPCS